MKVNIFQSTKEELLEGDPEKMEETARIICSIPDAKLLSIKELAEKDFGKLKRKTRRRIKSSGDWRVKMPQELLGKPQIL